MPAILFVFLVIRGKHPELLPGEVLFLACVYVVIGGLLGIVLISFCFLCARLYHKFTSSRRAKFT